MTGTMVRVRKAAVAGLLAIALVAGVGSLHGANASALQGGSPVNAAIAGLQRIEASASYLAVQRAVLTGAPVPAAAQRALQADVDALFASDAVQAAMAEIAPLTTGVAAGERGVPEFVSHVNRGNAYVLAAVNIFTVVVVPQALYCRVGDATCIPAWVLVGASLAAGAVVNAGFEYVAAVLALP